MGEVTGTLLNNALGKVGNGDLTDPEWDFDQVGTTTHAQC